MDVKFINNSLNPLSDLRFLNIKIENEECHSYLFQRLAFSFLDYNQVEFGISKDDDIFENLTKVTLEGKIVKFQPLIDSTQIIKLIFDKTFSYEYLAQKLLSQKNTETCELIKNPNYIRSIAIKIFISTIINKTKVMMKLYDGLKPFDSINWINLSNQTQFEGKVKKLEEKLKEKEEKDSDKYNEENNMRNPQKYDRIKNNWSILYDLAQNDIPQVLKVLIDEEQLDKTIPYKIILTFFIRKIEDIFKNTVGSELQLEPCLFGNSAFNTNSDCPQFLRKYLSFLQNIDIPPFKGKYIMDLIQGIYVQPLSDFIEAIDTFLNYLFVFSKFKIEERFAKSNLESEKPQNIIEKIIESIRQYADAECEKKLMGGENTNSSKS